MYRHLSNAQTSRYSHRSNDRESANAINKSTSCFNLPELAPKIAVPVLHLVFETSSLVPICRVRDVPSVPFLQHYRNNEMNEEKKLMNCKKWFDWFGYYLVILNSTSMQITFTFQCTSRFTVYAAEAKVDCTHGATLQTREVTEDAFVYCFSFVGDIAYPLDKWI